MINNGEKSPPNKKTKQHPHQQTNNQTKQNNKPKKPNQWLDKE